MKNFKILILILIFFHQVSSQVVGDSVVAYASTSGTCGINCPKVRFWNNSANTWGSEIELQNTTAPVREARVYIAPNNQKILIITQNNNGEIDIYGSWNNATNWTHTRNLTKLWTTAPAVHYRGFDLAYEYQTNNALLVFSVVNTSVNCDVGYYIIPAQSLVVSGNYGCIDDTTIDTDITSRFVRAVAKPNYSSREIIAATTETTQDDVNAWVWNGTAWGNQKEIAINAISTGDYEAMDIAYSGDNGSIALFAAGEGVDGFVNYSFWNGSSWTTSSGFDIDASDANDVRWLRIKPQPNNSTFALISVDSGSDLAYWFWNGSAWTNNVSNVDTAVDSATTRPADVEWINSTSGYLVWDTDTTGTTISRRNITNGVLSAANTYSSYAGTDAWLDLYKNPNESHAAKIIGIRMNSVFSLGSFYMNNTAIVNLGDSILTSNTTASTTGKRFGLDFFKVIDRDGPEIISTNSNTTNTNINTDVCVYAEALDQYKVPISRMEVYVRYPNNTQTWIDLNDTGCNAGSAGDGVWGQTINVGSLAGNFTINTTRAYDAFGNSNSTYPNLNITVESPEQIVDISISSSTLSFGSLDPGTNDNPATENPITLTNTANSNTAVDVYLNNTNMTTGTYYMLANQLSVNTANNAGTSTPLNGATYINGTSANQGFIENLAVNSNVNLYFWHDVPSGQQAGSYTATVTIHAVADGLTP
ncbi:MAG: hypothetical protein NC918_00310 [Candidatus Omnitrophica bacterium]|nr:hypothetical protein [Candidatus Omnitrophota bacterium]